MIPQSEPESPPELTPLFAVGVTIGAVFLQLLLYLALITPDTSFSAGRFGIATILAYGTAFAIAVPRIPAPPGTALGFVAAPGVAWSAALLLLPSVLLISELDNVLRAFYPLPEELRSEPSRPEGLALLELALVSIAVLPLVEEVFFRGLIQPRLVEQLGRFRAVLATAVLNGLSMLTLGGPWALATGFAGGIVLGVLRESARSLLPCLLLNALFGLTAFLATLQAFGIAGFDDTCAAHTPLEWLVPAALATGAGFRLCQSLLGRETFGGDPGHSGDGSSLS